MPSKAHIGMIVAMVTLLFCSMVQAAELETPHFSMTVADGWTAALDGDTAVLVAKDKSAALTVLTAEKKGKSLQELANALSQEYFGTTPKLENGSYLFSFTSAAMENIAIVAGKGERYFFFIITGTHDELQNMLDSWKEK
jgi:hypothetical protein